MTMVCYVINRVSIRSLLSKTPYELYKGRKPNVSHVRSFGCKCFILNNEKYPIGKIDAKSDEAIFIGYALNAKAYKVFNKTSLIVEKLIHVVFDETNVAPRKGIIVDDEADIEELKEKIARKIHPWKIYKEKKINMMIS